MRTSRPAPIELIERRAIFVRHEEMAGPRVDDEAFRIEAAAERAFEPVQIERVEAIQLAGRAWQETARVGELDGFDDAEVGDGAGEGVDVDREALNPGGVLDESAAGAAIGERPPFLACGVVVNVGKEAEAAAVGARHARGIEAAAGDHDAVDEDRAGGGRAGARHRERGDTAQKKEVASHESPLDSLARTGVRGANWTVVRPRHARVTGVSNPWIGRRRNSWLQMTQAHLHRACYIGAPWVLLATTPPRRVRAAGTLSVLGAKCVCHSLTPLEAQ